MVSLRLLATVNLKKIEDNLTALKKQVGHSDIWPVVKANAYGIGLDPVLEICQSHGISHYCVGAFEEVAPVKSRLPDATVLVFTPPTLADLPVIQTYNPILTAWHWEDLEPLIGALPSPVDIHAMVDTGMHRYGCAPEALEPLLTAINQSPHLNLTGIYSHLANAQTPESEANNSQIQRFNELTHHYSGRVTRHLANSWGAYFISDSHFDAVRPGFLLYDNCLTLEARVINVLNILASEPVGYGGKYISPSDTHIAVISAGYADGIPFSADNLSVIIQGKKYPVVGSVTMDSILVDIGAKPTIKNGDTATFIGQQGNTSLSIDDMAVACGQIPYAIMTGLAGRTTFRYSR